jgi:hypothetical protein
MAAHAPASLDSRVMRYEVSIFGCDLAHSALSTPSPARTMEELMLFGIAFPKCSFSCLCLIRDS